MCARVRLGTSFAYLENKITLLRHSFMRLFNEESDDAQNYGEGNQKNSRVQVGYWDVI